MTYRPVSVLRIINGDLPDDDSDWRLINVYEGTGRGWQLYERVDLADQGHEPTSVSSGAGAGIGAVHSGTV